MKDLVAQVSKIFNREKVKYVVIGALARDIFFEQKNIKLDVRTKDVDFAVLVNTWKDFEKVKNLLLNEMKMTQDPSKVYRLMLGGIPVDLLPFGKISEPGATIKWPGTFREGMKVMGFKEAYEKAATIKIEEVGVQVVIPEILVALKLESWSLATDRVKDAMDVRLILENIQDLCPDLQDDFHNDENIALLEKYAQDEDGLWISTLGFTIQKLLKGTELSDYLKTFISSAGNRNLLINDMNSGNIPNPELKIQLERMMMSLADGLKI